MSKLRYAIPTALAITGAAHAQQPPESPQCSENQTKTVSAALYALDGKGVVGCQEARPVLSQETHTVPPATTKEIVTEKVEKFSRSSVAGPAYGTKAGNQALADAQMGYTPDAQGGKFSYKNGNSEFGVSGVYGNTTGSGIKVDALTGGETWAIGGDVIAAKNLKSAFLAAGFNITQDVNGTFSVSYASESAAQALGNKDYQGNIKAASVSAGLHWGQAFLRFLHERGYDTTLMTTASSSVNITEEDMGTATRRITTTINRKEVTLWDAYARNSVVAGWRQNLGERGQATYSLGASHDPVHGTQAVGGVNLAYYGGGYKVDGGVQTQGKGMVTATLGVTGQLDPNWSAYARVQHTPAHDNMKSNTMAQLGVQYSFDSVRVGNRYVRPSDTTPTPQTLVREMKNDTTLHVKPASLGITRVEVTETKKVDTQDTPNAPKGIDKASIKTKINADGTVTVTFTPRAGGWLYEANIDGGAWTSTTGTITTAVLAAGNHSVNIREINPKDKTLVGPAATVNFTLSADNPTVETNNVVNATETTASIALSLADADGVSNYTCQVYQNGSPIGSPVSPSGNVCSVSGLTAGTSYVMVEKALVGVKKPDATITMVAKEHRTSFNTKNAALIAPTLSFASASVTKNVGDTYQQSLTTNSTGTLTWSSSDTSVATVDASGKVTLLKAGTATITANQSATTTHTAGTASYTIEAKAVVPPLDFSYDTSGVTSVAAGPSTFNTALPKVSWTGLSKLIKTNGTIQSWQMVYIIGGADYNSSASGTGNPTDSFTTNVIETPGQNYDTLATSKMIVKIKAPDGTIQTKVIPLPGSFPVS